MKRILASCFSVVFAGAVVAQGCYQSTITSPSPFMGNNDEIFKLSDGSVWQVKYEYEYSYEYSPSVVICPSRGKLAVNGMTLNVQAISRAPAGRSGEPQTSGVVESQIDGEFEGWDGETIFKLTNGQIWQQSRYAYTYSYKYRPNVIIFSAGGDFKLQVEGVDQRISVVRLK